MDKLTDLERELLEALKQSHAVLLRASRQLTEVHKVALGEVRWGETTIQRAEQAIAKAKSKAKSNG